jgi:hypothetical protein
MREYHAIEKTIREGVGAKPRTTRSCTNAFDDRRVRDRELLSTSYDPSVCALISWDIDANWNTRAKAAIKLRPGSCIVFRITVI